MKKWEKWVDPPDKQNKKALPELFQSLSWSDWQRDGILLVVITVVVA